MSQSTSTHDDDPAAHGFAARGRRFVQNDRYVLVLLLIVASIMADAFLGDGFWGWLLSLGLLSATLLVSLGTSNASRRTLFLARAAVLVSFAGILFVQLFDYSGLARLALLLTLLLLSTFTPVVIARRLWQHPVVSVNTLAGAADIYLLVGLLYALLYSLIGGVQAGLVNAISGSGVSHAVAASEFFAASRPVSPADFFYYSFTTLTTVGYGDLTATTDIGRLLSNTEALFGQLYLVTVVALIVSNIGRSRHTRGDAATEEDRPE